MNLTVGERLVIQSILPQEGDIVTLRVLRKLKENLSFSEEEIKLYKFDQKENTITWDNSVEQTKEVELGDKAKDIIVKALSKLNDQKKLRAEHISIYERFIPES